MLLGNPRRARSRRTAAAAAAGTGPNSARDDSRGIRARNSRNLGPNSPRDRERPAAAAAAPVGNVVEFSLNQAVAAAGGVEEPEPAYSLKRDSQANYLEEIAVCVYADYKVLHALWSFFSRIRSGVCSIKIGLIGRNRFLFKITPLTGDVLYWALVSQSDLSQDD